ncbi:hypothetical protein F5J12DRAFT_795639 [Pisolithus orientalis]|uniref:uncharacterized protein n=1 Tax=Pisolithus orientalis TaxID=936130 RepID=UPI0022246AA5|nr:uncharacterized protein F5J12DRAFT_795639 [Pisolithus orientalis]KAI6032638.1 hypothetical protein F5J12DRAFT_795639 [Pisolithus orientalis]
MANAGPLWQNSLYIGNILSTILYGVELSLYCQTMRALGCSATGSRDSLSHHTVIIYRCFSSLFLFLVSIFVLVEAIFGQQMWIIHYGYVGGMAQLYVDQSSVWYQILGLMAIVLLQLSSDALLIYRLYLLWKRIWVLVLPCILWVGTVVLGALFCSYCAAQHGNIFAGDAALIAVAYYAVAIALNLLVTSMLCGQMLTIGRKSRRQYGSVSSWKYFNAASVIIESALPCTAVGIAFLVTFALDSGVSVAFLSLYVMLTCVSPQMLILHAAQGTSYDLERKSIVGVLTPSASPMRPRPPPLSTSNLSRSRMKEDISPPPLTPSLSLKHDFPAHAELIPPNHCYLA